MTILDPLERWQVKEQPWEAFTPETVQDIKESLSTSKPNPVDNEEDDGP